MKEVIKKAREYGFVTGTLEPSVHFSLTEEQIIQSLTKGNDEAQGEELELMKENLPFSGPYPKKQNGIEMWFEMENDYDGYSGVERFPNKKIKLINGQPVIYFK